MISLGGDVHHIFPKKYLIKNNYSKNFYNQEANYAYLDRPVNESIGMRAPKDYFSLALKQCETKQAECGSIIDADFLKVNLAANCIPENICDLDCDLYPEFLEQRRLLMAQKIRSYYESL